MNTDKPEKIRAVWTVDQVHWKGEPVTEVAWFSTGGDPRSSIGYLDPKTSALRYRYVTSTTKSTLTVVHPDKFVDTEVKIDGEVKTETLDLSHKVFDRWGIGYALAGMELEEGMAFWKLPDVGDGKPTLTVVLLPGVIYTAGSPQWKRKGSCESGGQGTKVKL